MSNEQTCSLQDLADALDINSPNVYRGTKELRPHHIFTRIGQLLAAEAKLRALEENRAITNGEIDKYVDQMTIQ